MRIFDQMLRAFVFGLTTWFAVFFIVAMSCYWTGKVKANSYVFYHCSKLVKRVNSILKKSKMHRQKSPVSPVHGNKLHLQLNPIGCSLPLHLCQLLKVFFSMHSPSRFWKKFSVKLKNYRFFSC